MVEICLASVAGGRGKMICLGGWMEGVASVSVPSDRLNSAKKDVLIECTRVPLVWMLELR